MALLRLIKCIFFSLLFYVNTMCSAYSLSLLPYSSPGIEAFCCDSSETRMVISIVRGGLWKTEDGGSTWIPLNDRFVYDNEVMFYSCHELFTIDANCDTIFAKLDFIESTLHEYICSFDGGDTWNHFRLDDDILFSYGNFLRQDHFDSGIFYYIDPHQLRTTNNFFDDWTSSVHGPYLNQIFSFKQSTLNDSVFFVTTVAISDLQPGGVIRSLDYGNTWEPLIYPQEFFGKSWLFIDDIIPLTNNELIAFPTLGKNLYDEDEYLYFGIRSYDNGNTWTIEPDIFPLHFRFKSAIEVPEYPGTLLALGHPGYANHGLLKSEDYGHSFHQIQDSFPALNNSFNNLWYNKHNRNIYICCMEKGVYKSSNGGRNWVTVEGLPDSLGHLSNYALTESKIFLKSCLRNNLYSYDFNNSVWEEYPEYQYPLDSLFNISPVLVASNTEYLAVKKLYLDNNNLSTIGIIESTNDGRTWQSKGDTLVSYFDLLDNEYGPSVYQSSNILRFIVNNLNRNSLYTGCYITSDTGRSWTYNSFSSDVFSTPLYAQNETTIYMSISQLGVWKSNDEGITWTNLEMPNNVSWQYHSPPKYNDANSLLYIFTANRLLSYDGTNWTELGNYYQWPFTVAMVPAEVPKFFYTSMDNRITASLDGGVSWFILEIEHEYFSQIATVSDIKYDPWRDRIWVMTGLGPMYINVEDVTGVSDEPVSLYPADFELLTSYPNPFNENSRIVFNLKETDEIKLELFDITGRQVQTVIEGSYQAGKHEVFLDGSQLASGIYFLKLNTSEGVRTHKVTLVK